jgi:hypothetical protein|tara:strand:- start:1003 stop:1764 length:762 start_codon:yes stop_codon:yes gene_type:complete
MAFDIDSFTAEMHSVGFARPSDFEVEIGGDILSKVGSSFGLSSSLMFRVNTAELPQRNVEAISYAEYGAPYKIGGGVNYVDTPISIICSPDLREREFFMRWQDLIGGFHRNPDLDADQRKNQFNIGYYDNYVAKKGITIYQLDQQGFKTYAVDLIDAYPIVVSPLSLSWANGSEVQVMNVTIAFRYFEERNQSQLGTQLRIGRDGLQIAGGLNLPFSIAGIKNQAKTQLNPRKLMTNLSKKSGISFTGLPKIF